MAKTKILVWGDYCCSTGFATVNSNIMRELYKTGNYDIDVIAVNYDGGVYDTNKFPGQVWPAISALRQQGSYADLFGRQVFLDFLGRGDYDLVFVIQDTFIVEPIADKIREIQAGKAKSFSSIYYYPFDCPPKPSWVEKAVASFDYPVPYTEYAREETRRYLGDVVDSFKVIYHGTNTKDFYPLPQEQIQTIRKALFGVNADRFIVTNVNRNQGRKDIGRTLMILKELKRRGHDDIFFYLHMQESDFGGSVLAMAQALGLDPNTDFTIPNPAQFSAHSGFPIEVVNQLYNSSDCYLTTTLGEGWGLSITEAMACKLPVVAPDNTSLPEILGEDRGWRVPSGSTPSHWVMKENDNDRVRPLMDVEAAADAILEVKAGLYPERVDNAYNWVTNVTWENVCKDWNSVFNKAVNKLKSAQLLKANKKE